MAAKHEILEVEIYQQDTTVVEDNMIKKGKNIEEICQESNPMNMSTKTENDPQNETTENIQPNSNATNSHKQDTKVVEDNMNKEGVNREEICWESKPMNIPAIEENNPHDMTTENIQSSSIATNLNISEPGNISLWWLL